MLESTLFVNLIALVSMTAGLAVCNQRTSEQNFVPSFFGKHLIAPSHFAMDISPITLS